MRQQRLGLPTPNARADPMGELLQIVGKKEADMMKV